MDIKRVVNNFIFYIKDLSNLNRSLNRVIIIDTDSTSVKYQPENSVILDKWTGDIYDTALSDLVPFLLSELMYYK